jgi:biopolymer transport protein ExbB/TolQ
MNQNIRTSTILYSILAVGMFYLGMWIFTSPGNRLYEFFFHRTFVQCLITGTFSLTMVLLIQRFSGILNEKANLLKLTNQDYCPEEVNSKAIVQVRLTQLHNYLIKHGGVAASTFAERIKEEDEQTLQREYGLINNLIQTTLALGFFGTVYGLSGSLFEAFSSTNVTTDTIGQSISRFTQALSTALDTTILGLVCGMIAGVFAMICRRQEETLFLNIGNFIRKRLSLDNFIALKSIHVEGQIIPTGSAQEAYIEEFKAELRSVTGAIVENTKTAMARLIAEIAESYRVKISETIKDVLDDAWRHEETVAEKIARQLSDRLSVGIERAATGIEKQNGRLLNTLVNELKRMEKNLQKAPEEIIVRWPSNPTTKLELTK